MTHLKLYSLIVLFIYSAVLLVAVAKEKKNRTILDYFFRRQNASIFGLYPLHLLLLGGVPVLLFLRQI